MTETTLRTYYLQSAGGHIFLGEELHEGNLQIAEPVQADSRTEARTLLNNVIKAAELTRGMILEVANNMRRQCRAEPAPDMRTYDGIFKSAHEALTFAFTFKTQQYPRTPMTQLLAGGSLGSGRGLSGIDGAGQAGMVLQELEGLEPGMRSVIIGKFSRPVECPCCGADAPSADYGEAVEYLSHLMKETLKGTTCNSRVRRELVRRYLGGKVSMTLLATTTGIDRRTLTNHYAKVAKQLAQIEKRARATLDELLEPMVVTS